MNNDFRSGLRLGFFVGIALMGMCWAITIQLYHDKLVEVKAQARRDSEDQFKSCAFALDQLVKQYNHSNEAIPEQSEDLRRF